MPTEDTQTFDREISELLPRLRRFAHALSRNFSDADDLAQSTVERALRSRLQWKPGTRLDSWLYKIMRNLWIDTVRHRARKQTYEAPPEEAENLEDDPTKGLEANAELRRVMQAMEKLPGEQREVVALILVEGFGYRETAEMLEVPGEVGPTSEPPGTKPGEPGGTRIPGDPGKASGPGASATSAASVSPTAATRNSWEVAQAARVNGAINIGILWRLSIRDPSFSYG